MLQRAFSLLSVKTVDDNRRVITGIATTPTADRMGDEVVPTGARFKTPMPLLLYHKSDKPVGTVDFAKATKEGIPFTASLPNVVEAGTVQDRVNEAWHSLKYKLVGAVSIGFRPLEDGIELLKSGGLRFTGWEWLELSLVSVPANPDAVIQSFKSLDAQQVHALLGTSPDDAARAELIKSIRSVDQAFLRAVSGREQSREAEPTRPSPGVPGSTAAVRGTSIDPKQGSKVKTIQEQIAAAEAKRSAHAARMSEIMSKSHGDEGRETDEEEGREFDALQSEVTRIETDLVRLRAVEKLHVERSVAVQGHNQTQGANTTPRGPTILVRSGDQDEKFKGQNFTRRVIAKALAYLSQGELTPAQVAEARWGKSAPTLVQVIRAGVAGGGSGSGEWGAELVTADGRYMGDFIEYLNSRTVFNQLALREIPAHVTIKGADGAATGYWVGESKPIPVSKPDFFNVTLTPLKVGAISVVSNELMRDSTPAAEMLVRDALVEAAAQRIDSTFLSDTAAVAGSSPAGILRLVSAHSSSGSDAESIRADIAKLYAPFITAKNATGLVFVMNPSLAKNIQLMRNALGQREFDGVISGGGTLEGDGIVVGDNVNAAHLILLKPSDIYKIGDGGVEVSLSREATIEQADDPTGATDTPVAQTNFPTSMFQAESTAIKVVRSMNFAKRRASAVQYIDDADYGSQAS